jgi:hypothetical protein
VRRVSGQPTKLSGKNGTKKCYDPNSALSELQSLLDSINASVAKIQAAASVAEDSVPDSCREDLRDLLKSGLSLTDCAKRAVKIADRGLLAAVKRHVRLVLDGRAEREELATIAAIEKALYTPAEQAASEELQEVSANVGRIRGEAPREVMMLRTFEHGPLTNHEVLEAYFRSAANVQTFVDGQHAAPESINAWIPFENGRITNASPKLRLSDGLPDSDPLRQFVGNGGRVTWVS